jgi:hypothetical protein
VNDTTDDGVSVNKQRDVAIEYFSLRNPESSSLGAELEGDLESYIFTY